MPLRGSRKVPVMRVAADADVLDLALVDRADEVRIGDVLHAVRFVPPWNTL